MDKQDGQDTEGFDAFIRSSLDSIKNDVLGAPRAALSILPIHVNKRAIKDLTPLLTGCICANLQTQFDKP